jgi:hypothetical protein
MKKILIRIAFVVVLYFSGFIVLTLGIIPTRFPSMAEDLYPANKVSVLDTTTMMCGETEEKEPVCASTIEACENERCYVKTTTLRNKCEAEKRNWEIVHEGVCEYQKKKN